MAVDQQLTRRVSEAFGEIASLEEKKMFGGIAFLINGNMACGILKENLIVRVGTEQYEKALSQPYVKQFDVIARPMRGWVMVEPPGYEHQDDLNKWVSLGLAYVLTLPAK